MKLIDKDAVVTMIKNRMATNLHENPLTASAYVEDEEILDALDTIEVKEVDLEHITKISGWVARQPEGELWLFAEPPYYNSNEGMWGTAIGGERELEGIDTTIFKDLQFYDEPVEVELTIRIV